MSSILLFQGRRRLRGSASNQAYTHLSSTGELRTADANLGQHGPARTCHLRLCIAGAGTRTAQQLDGQAGDVLESRGSCRSKRYRRGRRSATEESSRRRETCASRCSRSGYADGIPHRLSNRGRVIVRGKLAPILGAVSMDLTTIDMTHCPEVQSGEAVTILGSEATASTIDAQEIAGQAGTISYSVLCGISSRVKRVYICTARDRFRNTCHSSDTSICTGSATETALSASIPFL